MDNNMEQVIYYMTLDMYLKNNGLLNQDINTIFSKEWFEINNYRLLTDILSEAIDKKIKYNETSRYNNYLKEIAKEQ